MRRRNDQRSRIHDPHTVRWAWDVSALCMRSLPLPRVPARHEPLSGSETGWDEVIWGETRPPAARGDPGTGVATWSLFRLALPGGPGQGRVVVLLQRRAF